MNTPQYPAIIGNTSVSSLFRIFGCLVYDTDKHSVDTIIQKIVADKDSLGLIFIAGDIELSPRQKKTLHLLDIPLSLLPIDTSTDSTSELKKLTEKAVGVSIDTLFQNSH